MSSAIQTEYTHGAVSGHSNEFGLKRFGDKLEKKYSTLIDERLSAYELIWKLYIGHDGRGRYINIPHLADNEKIRRDNFCQFHYTCLESVICLSHIKDSITTQKTASFENYLDVINKLLAYQAHTGRIRDLLKEMGILFDIPNLHKELEEYYQQRNEVLHGRKLPFLEIAGDYAIPRIKGAEPNDKNWHDKKSWFDVSPEDFIFLSDYFKENFDKITKLLNASLYAILEKITDVVKYLDIDIKNEMYGKHKDFSNLYNLTALSSETTIFESTPASGSLDCSMENDDIIIMLKKEHKR